MEGMKLMHLRRRRPAAAAAVPYAEPSPADVELTAELVERVRAHLARDRAIALMRLAPLDVWPTADVLDDYLAEVVR